VFELWPKLAGAGWRPGEKEQFHILVYLLPPSTNACVSEASCAFPWNVGTDYGAEHPFQILCRDDPDENATGLVVVVDDPNCLVPASGSFSITSSPECAKALPCETLISPSDLPYPVIFTTTVPIPVAGDTDNFCEYLGFDAKDNPLVTGDLALSTPSIAIAKQALGDEKRRFPGLQPVKSIGDQALTGCFQEGPSGCEVLGTIARLKQIIAIVNTNTDSVDTRSLMKKIMIELASAKT
jgi:hypothetical protein